MGDTNSGCELSERLAELGVLDDPAMVDSFLEVFLSSATSLRTALGEALQGADVAAAHVAVHTLKGASRNLGASSLAHHCMLLEQALAAGQRTEQIVADLDAELHKVQMEIATLAARISGGR